MLRKQKAMKGENQMRNIPTELDQRLMEQTDDDRDYSYNHCSEAGWVPDCMRRLILLRRMPPRIEEVDLSMRRRFEEGHRQEILMRGELKEAGYKITPIADSLTWDKYKLKGRPDDLIYLDEKLPNVIDYKSCSPYVFKEVKRFNRWEDFLKSRYHWIRHAPGQTMLYIPLLTENEVDVDLDSSILYFKDKDSGEKHQVFIYYDDPYVQLLLKGLKKVNEYVENKTNLEPDYKDDCRWCAYKNYCFKEDKVLRNGLESINNEEAERVLTRMAELEPSKEEYKKLHEQIRTEFLGHNVIIGDFKLTTTDYNQTTFQVPKEVKEEYRQTVPRQRFNIDRLTKVL